MRYKDTHIANAVVRMNEGELYGVAMARRQRGIRAARNGEKIVTLRTWRRRSRVKWEYQAGLEGAEPIVRSLAFDFGESCWVGDDCLQGRPPPKTGRSKVRPAAALVGSRGPLWVLLGGLGSSTQRRLVSDGCRRSFNEAALSVQLI